MKKSNSSLISFVLASICFITLIAYLPILNNGFTNWDDNIYIANNDLIKSMDATHLQQMFAEGVCGNYHPLTMLSLAVNYHFSQLNPVAYLTTNVFLHVFNSLLVFFFIYLLSGKKIIVASVTSALFAFHPMHVESVAWASERKDVLYVFFFLLSCVSYTAYVLAEQGKYIFPWHTRHKRAEKISHYITILVYFILSLLSKGMAVVFPVVMLLIDYFLKRKFTWKTGTEKIPFFILSMIFGFVAIKFQKDVAAFSTLSNASIIHRLLYVPTVLTDYLGALIMPLRQSAFYPVPSDVLVMIANTCGFAIVFALFVLSVKSGTQKYKTISFGGMFFLIAILPVLPFFPVGQVVMADRYTYLSSVGLFFLAGTLVDSVYYQSNVFGNRLYLISCTVIILCCYCVITYIRVPVWHSGETLWTDAIYKYPEAYKPYFLRADVRNKNQNLTGAMQDYNMAIKLNPQCAEAYSNRAILKAKNNDYAGTVNDCDSAIMHNPELPEAYNSRGIALCMLNKNTSRAIADFTKAIALKSDYSDAYFNRSIAHNHLQHYADALNDILKAQQLGYDVDSGFVAMLKSKN